jgi:hypothetical protein
MVLATALATQISPATSQAAPAPSPAPRSVAIPFDPPLGRMLAYRMTSVEMRGGQPQTMTLEMRIVFRRDGAGYVMTTTYDLPPGLPRGHPMVAVLMRPLELRLDADGAIVGMVDEPAYWAGIDAIMDDIIRSLGADTRATGAVRAAFRAMRDMPDEDRLGTIARNVFPLVEYGGIEMAVGETREEAFESETPLGPVAQEAAVTLEGIDGDTARLRSVARLAPGQIERVTRHIQERYGVTPRPEAGDAASQLPPERVGTYRVSLRTGLTERYSQTVSTPARPGAAPAPPRQTRTIVRIP